MSKMTDNIKAITKQLKNKKCFVKYSEDTYSFATYLVREALADSKYTLPIFYGPRFFFIENKNTVVFCDSKPDLEVACIDLTIPMRLCFKLDKSENAYVIDHLNANFNIDGGEHGKHVGYYYYFVTTKHVNSYVSNKNNIIATEITIQEYKDYFMIQPPTNNDTLIGYECPHDLYKGRIKKGTLFNLYSPNGFVMYSEKHTTSSVPTEIVHTWKPVYKKKSKIFTLQCRSHPDVISSFELEVSSDGIYYKPDNIYLNVDDLRNIVSHSNFELKGNLPSNVEGTQRRYQCHVHIEYVDLGCKKRVPADDVRAVLNCYYEMYKNSCDY